jgi:ribonuclease HI
MKITIFTDGSSRGNPGPGGWGSVVVLGTNAGAGATVEVTELGGGEAHTTNNRMEIQAAIGGLGCVTDSQKSQKLSENMAITINTDSSYLINGITKWVKGWQAKGWKTAAKEEVQNRDLWEDLIAVVDQIKTSGGSIIWNYVGGHIGIAGNERCDEIATAFADGEQPELYRGAIGTYQIKNILDVSIDSVSIKEKSAEKSEKNSRSRAKAYSYVSAINGEVQVHQSWAECEVRVKGKSGARFKKALSAGEERAIVAEFSV